ncbi:MAG TPA: hypothetical protein VK814_03540 [Acidobacteriaceae bacterium]|jgi:hypothetical protein|nr:hypothetical protein [Acidobacteriaceae bacterium]
MHIPDAYISGFVAAIVSTIGTLIASRISFRAVNESAKKASDGIKQQIDFQTRAKLAEFRQAWINELRVQMSTLQSLGVTPNLPQAEKEGFYKAGTMIELLMDRNDPQFAELQSCMYSFLAAQTIEEKYSCNAPYVHVCQDVLKAEWERLKKELVHSPDAGA